MDNTLPLNKALFLRRVVNIYSESLKDWVVPFPFQIWPNSMAYKWGVILTTEPSPGMILQLASNGFFSTPFFAPQVLYIQVYRSACLSSQHSTPGEGHGDFEDFNFYVLVLRVF